MDNNENKAAEGLGHVVATRLKTLRGDKSKAKFAAELGISPSSYQWYEDGRIPDPKILIRIALYHKVTIDWLFGLVEEKGTGVDMARQSGQILPIDQDRSRKVAQIICSILTPVQIMQISSLLLQHQDISEEDRVVYAKIFSDEAINRLGGNSTNGKKGAGK